jgi:hypothetical protein
MTKIAISCLVENSPKFAMRGWNWLTSLNALRTPTCSQLFVHHNLQLSDAHLDAFSMVLT